MQKSAMIVALSVVLCSVTLARADADEQTFDLSPVAPPTPALKYELLVDPIDQQSGNAATYYQQAFAAWTKDADGSVDKALNAADRDPAAFESFATAAYDKNKKVFDILDAAARQDQCDWQTPLHEMGFRAPLPYLHDMQQMARLVAVHTRQQIRHGKIDEAVASLRLGYGLGRNVASDPVLVSGLVGMGVDDLLNDVLAELMSHPQSPNFYWALASLPRPMISFRHAMEHERYHVFASYPVLAKARLGELSAQEWRVVFKQIDQDMAKFHVTGRPPSTEQAALSLLPQARAYYAQTRHLTAGEVEKLDALAVVGAYCLEQYLTVADDQWKLTSLPYPILLPMAQQLQIPVQAGNPWMNFVAKSFGKAASVFARLDRGFAALTAVEAIRSYAAANGGRLPPTLQNITDTPVPDNPYTGQAFDYTVENDTATLSDPQPADYPLKYTIRIRK
ncbi:MAG: hypothetical protein ABR964_01110 [Tepidisphaeraceae bacterium]|jgi:hypothetical protein